jgi:hypothetical protein
MAKNSPKEGSSGKEGGAQASAPAKNPQGKGINWREHYLKFVGFGVVTILFLYLTGAIKIAVDDYTLGLLVILILLPLIDRIQKIKFKDIEVVMVESSEVEDAKKKASEAEKEQPGAQKEQPAAKKAGKKAGAQMPQAQVRSKGLYKMALPPLDFLPQESAEDDGLAPLEASLYDEADTNPGAAAVSLSTELEKQVSRIYSKSAKAGGYASFRQMLAGLRSQGIIGDPLFEGINAIISIRNRVAHGERLKPSDARALVDSGMKLMRILLKM